MIKTSSVAALAVVLLAGIPQARADGDAQIPFANHGGVYDWKPDGTDAILIESRTRQYYRATFIGPCHNLPFTETVGFVTDARDVIDKFQSITVGHEQCYFKDFRQVPKPPGFAS